MLKRIFSLYLLLFVCILGCSRAPEPRPNAELSVDQAWKKHIDSGTSISARGDYLEAVQYADSIFRKPEFNLPSAQISYYRFRSTVLIDLHDYPNAMFTVNELFKYLDSLPEEYKQEYIYAYYLRGDIYYNVGNFQAAYRSYYNAFQLGESMNNVCASADFDYRLGMSLYREEKYELSATFFKRAFNSMSACNDDFILKYRRQELLNNVGWSYCKIRRFDSAKVYFQHTLNYLDTMPKRIPDNVRYAKVASGVVYGNMGWIEKENKNYPEAIRLFKKNIAINLPRPNETRDAIHSLYYLAEIYDELDSSAQFIHTTNTINTLLDSLPNPGVKQRTLALTWRFYLSKNDFERAARDGEMYIAVRDSIEQTRKISQRSNVQEMMQLLDSETQIERLRLENENKSVFIKYVFILITLIVFIVLIMIVNARSKQKANDKLNELNKILQLQIEKTAQANNDLKKLNREKDRIMSLIAHDLRNPVGAMRNLVLLLQSTPMSDTERNEVYEMIKNAGDNSIELIEEILESSSNKVGLSENQLALEQIDINHLIKNCILLIRFKADEKNQAIHFEPNPAVIIIDIDATKIRRLVNNLLTNAIKFSHPGSQIFIKTSRTETHVTLLVQDKGLGISDEIRAHLWSETPIKQRMGTDGESSFGLGLQIVSQIVKLHKGKIDVKSTEGEGTTFEIQLPFRK